MNDPIRKNENIHILLWLIKDTCWLLELKVFATFIIIPTIALAIYIAIKTRQEISEFLHNIAIVFWISANSFWMLCEFFNFDQYRIYAIFPFMMGLGSVGYYYLIGRHSQK